LTISWRQQPNQAEIDALDANVALVGLVIRARWAIVALLVAFTGVAATIYGMTGVADGLRRQMLVPAAALVAVLAFNVFCERNYRRLGNIAVFNVVQLAVDIMAVSVVVYFSGGASSWFSAIYLLLVLEAALILPSRLQVFSIALLAWLAFTTVVAAVYFDVLPHTTLPFVGSDVQFSGGYIAVRSIWEFTVLSGAAGLGSALMGEIRRRDERLSSESILDARTGLLTREYFRRELEREIVRARRDRRGVSVVLADIDGFERFNETFGVDAGNTMIVAVAAAIAGAADAGPDAGIGLVSVARYGGEEFALAIAETVNGDDSAGAALAERVRAAVALIRDEDRSVTVSVGVAAYPVDGGTAAELVAAADRALAEAAGSGGDRVAAQHIAMVGDPR
jgi:diguanylate cyclase (GGDEF)-like protein